MDPEATEIAQAQLADGERLLWVGRQDIRRVRIKALRRLAPIYLGIVAFFGFFAWQASNMRRQFEVANDATYARMVHNAPAMIRQRTEATAQMQAAMRAHTPAVVSMVASPLGLPLFQPCFSGHL